MSTPITYETDHISLLHDLKMSTALNFLLLFFFYVFHRNLKKDRIRRNINSKKKKECLSVKTVLLLLFAENWGWLGPYNKKLSCLCLTHKYKNTN